jgi:hypothetical protein
MNNDIMMAVKSLCEDIVCSADPDDNKKRTEAIINLVIANRLISAEGENGSTSEPNKKIEGMENESEKPFIKDEDARTVKPGTHFTYNGMKFVALGYYRGGVLAITREQLCGKMQFDIDCCNDWSKSSLRKYLNEEYIKNFNKDDLIPIVSDLIADNGEQNYGISEDFITLLSDDLYRKYRDFVPTYNSSAWTVTPYSCEHGNAGVERIVDTSGVLSNSYALDFRGVAPICIFKPSGFKWKSKNKE